MTINVRGSLKGPEFKKIIMHNKCELTFSIIILLIITQMILLQSTPIARGQNSNYRDHFESYSSPRLKIELEYPSDWRILELDAPALSNLIGLVSLEPLKSERELQAVLEETPIFTITAEKAKIKNMTVDEYARLQSEGIWYLYSDFEFEIENKTAITVGNNTAIKIIYDVVDPYSDENSGIRNAMEIWTIRGDTVYTISYLGKQDQYFRYLLTIEQIIDSLEFIN
jgi:PsbP-like protein